MLIKLNIPEGPWNWVDAHDDEPVAPFIDSITGEESDPSDINIEGYLSLRTVDKTYDIHDVKGAGTFSCTLVDVEMGSEIDDSVLYALQAFPEIVEALKSFMGAVDPFIQSGDPADLKDRSGSFCRAYKAGLDAFRKARALIGDEAAEQIEMDI